MNDVVDKVISAVRANPEGVLLFGAGLALVLRKTTSLGTSAQSPRSKGGARKRTPTIVPDAVREAAGEVFDQASEYSDAVAEGAKRVYATTRSATKDFAQTSPFGVAIAGLAAGFVVAAAFPATDIERETLGPVARKASDIAGDAAENIKEAAVNAGTEALRAGLSAAVSMQERSDVR